MSSLHFDGEYQLPHPLSQLPRSAGHNTITDLTILLSGGKTFWGVGLGRNIYCIGKSEVITLR